MVVINHNKAVDEYNTLLGEINDTTGINYLILRSKEQDVDSKRRAATIFSFGAGLSIGYTLADALFLHKVFPKSVSLDIDAGKTALAMKVRF